MYISQQNQNMNLKFFSLPLLMVIFLYGCSELEGFNSTTNTNKQLYSSKGFALIYDQKLFENGTIKKKLYNDDINIIHSKLNANTYVEITNLDNLKSLKARVSAKSDYPNFFNVLITKKVAKILDLDFNNPYVEISQIKKNKTFIAKEGTIFEEEKKVAGTVSIDKIEIDIISSTETSADVKTKKDFKYIIFISDFYYKDSATNLKKKLYYQTGINNFVVRKINNKKYRLLVGPFESFDALKSTYISLNNLGFDELNIYKE